MKWLLIAGLGLLVLLAGCTQPVACPADIHTCPDGSTVSRTAPDCEFAACPSGNVCGNGECENEFGESQDNCPWDCSALPCKNEGETIPVVANPPECCVGLTKIPPKEEIPGISGICTALCGNGICDVNTESTYNCQTDCASGGPVCGNGHCEGAGEQQGCPQDCIALVTNKTLYTSGETVSVELRNESSQSIFVMGLVNIVRAVYQKKSNGSFEELILRDSSIQPEPPVPRTEEMGVGEKKSGLWNGFAYREIEGIANQWESYRPIGMFQLETIYSFEINQFDSNQSSLKQPIVKLKSNEFEIRDLNCAAEGESFSLVYPQYPEHCCAGLTEWEAGMDTAISVEGTCYQTGLVAGNPVGICISCGNGTCDDREDSCNCPVDCTMPINDDYPTATEFCSTAWTTTWQSNCQDPDVQADANALCGLCP